MPFRLRIETEEAGKLFARHMRVPFRARIERACPEALRFVPEVVARENHILPLDIADGVLTVAFGEIGDCVDAASLQFLFDCEVRLVATTRTEIEDAIDRSYGKFA